MAVETTDTPISQSFTCETCGTTFLSRQELKKHNMKLHSSTSNSGESNSNNYEADGSRRLNNKTLLVPQARTTIFALGIAAGLLAAGFAAYYISQRNKYNNSNYA